MKTAIRKILGKTISGIGLKEHENGHSTSQMFLLFDEDTNYELWTNGPVISGAGGVDPGGKDEVVAYGRGGTEVVLKAFIDDD